VKNPVPRSIGPKCNGTPVSLAMLFVLALSGCTTFKPPQISYDDDVPPSPDLPMPADDHARPLHVPPSWTPTRGGKKGDQEAMEPTDRIGTANDAAGRARGGQDISTRSKSFHSVPGRSIRSTLPQGRSRI
jgi:type IV secretion system protein VirB9